MATWECGECRASFRGHEDLEAHALGAHGRRRKATAPVVPRSAREKPLGPGPVADARAVRSGPARRFGPGERETPRPTGLTAGPPDDRERKFNPPPGEG